MKRIYYNLSDLIFGHFSVEKWGKIPSPIAELIEKPYYVDDYTTYTRYHHSYNVYVRQYLKDFDEKTYQYDCAKYFHYGLKNDLQTVANPYFYPQNIEGENFLINGNLVEKHTYHYNFNQDYETLLSLFERLMEKTPLVDILRLYKPNQQNLIEFLNPMVYSLLGDRERLADLQNLTNDKFCKPDMNKPIEDEAIPF